MKSIIFGSVEACYNSLPLRIQLSLQKKLQQKDSQRFTKIEFQNGDVSKIHNYDQQMSNKIQLLRKRTLLKSICMSVFPLENIFVVIILIILFAKYQILQDLTANLIIYYTLTCLALNIIFSLISIYVTYMERLKYQDQINFQTCTIFPELSTLQNEKKKLQTFKHIKWEDLKIGQIVCLQVGDSSPADLLILDSCQEQILINYEQRKPCPSTFINSENQLKGSIIDFKINLNGYISFMNMNDDSLHGTLKLKNDPKVTLFTSKNIILRGEVLSSINWIFGMVMRVGNDCSKLDQKIKSNYSFRGRSQILKYQIFIFTVCIFSLLLIIEIIMDTSTNQYDQIYSRLAYCLLLVPQNLLWLSQLWKLLKMIQQNQQFNQESQYNINKLKDQQKQDVIPCNIISEDQNNVLIPIPKQNTNDQRENNNLLIFKSSQKDKDIIQIKGCLAFSLNNLFDLVNTDLLVIESPENLIFTKYRVLQLLQDNNQYLFKYEKISDLLMKTEPDSKSNYEKLLIDTNRFQINDEKKPIDLDILISEKSAPQLRPVETKESSLSSSQKPKLRENSIKVRERRQNQEQKNNYTSFRKESARNLFLSNLSSHGSNSLNNSPKSITQQKSMFFNRMPSKNFQTINNHPKSQQFVISSDKLLGDSLTEYDFFEKLCSKTDLVTNELLICLLTCNNISSFYNEQTKQFEMQYSNRYEQYIVEFANQFDYKLNYSTVLTNYKSEYQVATIIKKALSIQGVSKIMEILCILEPTEGRPNTLSVLIRDPESFLLEEGSIMYTRIETYKIDGNQINKESQEQFNSMVKDGQKTFLYLRKQLNRSETEEFLKRYVQISETYGNRQEEFETHFSQIEKQSSILFSIGLKQIYDTSIRMSAQQIPNDQFQNLNLFNSFQKFTLKTCLIFELSYEELLLYLRTYQIITSNEQILDFHETEEQLLKFKIRQHITSLFEDKKIHLKTLKEYLSDQSQQKYIIVSNDSFNIIINDEYLKYHFAFIYQYAIGLSVYQFTSINKGKLLKLLKLGQNSILTVGDSLNNSYMFSKSNNAFCISQTDHKSAISKPNFIIHKLKYIAHIIFLYSQQEFIFFQILIETQFYRSLLLGFLIYQINFLQGYYDFFNFIIFFIFPSNIFNCIFKYQSFFKSNYQFQAKSLPLYIQKYKEHKQLNIIYSIFKISLFALIDSIILNLVFQISYINEQFSEAKIFQLYGQLELVEKIPQIIEILDDVSLNRTQKVKQVIFILIFYFSLNLVYQLSSMEIREFGDIYTKEGLQEATFDTIFSVGISGIIKSVLELFDINFTSLTQIDQLNILHPDLKQFALSQSIEPYYQKQFQHKNIIDKIFLNKDIIDEQISKFIQNDNYHKTDQLQKKLQFIDKRTERDYLNYIKYNLRFQINQFIVLLSYDIVLIIIVAYQTVNNEEFSISMVLTIISFAVQFILFILYYKVVLNIKIQVQLQVLSFILRFIYKICLNITGDYYFQYYLITIMYIFAFSTTFIPEIGIQTYIILTFISLIVDLIFVGVNTVGESNHSTFIILKAAIIFIGILYPIFYLVYRTEYLWRYSYILKNRLQAEYKKLNDVLGLLMPRFIKERMTKGQIQISEDQGEVTILFCDIYDFDKIIKSEQEMIVEFLDNLYRSFDQLCQSNELQKIETVGKTYMAAAGLKDYDVELNQQRHLHSTQRVLDTAIKMLEVAKTMKYGNNEELILKIGIHHGRVIAGVIGAHKPQFSLIGDTVNTTSRVCSTGESGYITLSESAYNNIKDQKYTFKLREVQAKGKGLINTFQLIINLKEQRVTERLLTVNSNTNEQQFIVEPKESIEILRNQTSIQAEDIDSGLKSRMSSNLIILKSPRQLLKKNLQTSTSRTAIKKIVSDDSNVIIKQGDYTKLDTYGQIDQKLNGIQSVTNIVQYQFKPDLVVKQNQFDNAIDLSPKILSNKKRSVATVKNQNIIPQRHQHSILQTSKKIFIQQLNSQENIQDLQQLHQHSQFQQQTKLQHLQQQPQQQQQQQQQQIQNARRSSIRKRGTIIIEKHPKLKRLPTKQFFDIQFGQKLNDGISNKSLQDTRKEQIDELEIPKIQYVISRQPEFDCKFIQQVLKSKTDQYQTIQENTIYKSGDQQKYNQQYDLYRNSESDQIFRVVLLLAIYQILKDSLYLIINSDIQQIVVQWISLVISKVFILIFMVIIIYKLKNKLNILKMKIVLVSYLIIISSLDIAILSMSAFLDFEIVLQIASITCNYINIFNLQIFNQYDRKLIIVIELIMLLSNTYFQKYWYLIIFYTIGISVMSYYSQYSEKLILVRNYQCNQQLESQQEKQKAILQYLLPAHILDRFISDQDNTESFTDVFENATVLFADIAGFTKYSSSVEPEQVVNMLRTLFQNFDEYCQKLNVYKLFTIGDCYVCMGIIDANNRDEVEEAVNVTLFGLKMIDLISSINNDPQFQHLNMRIGAHTGKLIGGVVGTDVVRYDVYGDDVTIANKMESNGQEGQMMVSETTKDLIESVYEDMFEFTFAKEVYIASKDMTISAYYVELSQSIYE